jgi:DNA-binding transcriptional LysR family regulator
MVLLDLPGTREHQRGHFVGSGRSPRLGHRATSLETVRSLVANGLGYAILVTKPAHDMSYSGKALASRPLAEELPRVRLVCARRRGVAPEPGALEFGDLCRRHFAHVPARAADTGPSIAPRSNRGSAVRALCDAVKL